jgi:hypothetical protein
MHSRTLITLAALAMLAIVGVLLVPNLFGGETVPMVTWSERDEIDVAEPLTAEEDPAAALESTERIAVATGQGPGPGERTKLVLRGRIVNKNSAPVADASVALDFGRGGPRERGGPQRRVPDPVRTDREGRFAFGGQTFRNLRVSLQVAHAHYAPGLFDRNLGEVDGEVDLGDLLLDNGGAILGRVTDLEGNGVAGATVQLRPDNGNRLGFIRDRDNLLQPLQADANGFFRIEHAAAGDWRVSATARMHQEGSSPAFAVEEDLQVDLDDIRLGPGYELAGKVFNRIGQPVARAEVVVRGGRENRDGRDHRTRTDEQGTFFLEHLPGVALDLSVDGEGYLRYEQTGIDAKVGQKLTITLQDGLKIAGRVVDAASNQPVTKFAVRANRVRGLPRAESATTANDRQLREIMSRARAGELDASAVNEIRMRFEAMRGEGGGDRARGRGPGGDGGRGDRGPGRGPGGENAWDRWSGFGDVGKVEDHPDGTFTVTGLQEGFYQVLIQSPEHARLRSAEVELRVGAAAPDLLLALDRGFSVSGTVRDEMARPVAGARVELRAAERDAAENGGRRSGRGGGGAGGDAGVGGRGMGQMLRQVFGSGPLVVATRTDAEGRFTLTHAPGGNYRVMASAPNRDTAGSEVFELQKDITGIALELGTLGTLTGKVLGFTATMTDAQVAAVPLPAGDRPTNFRLDQGGRLFVPVNANGTYRIEGLSPGGYVVRAFVGGPGVIMRELGPAMIDGSLSADTTVKRGETTTFDVVLVRPQTGVVAGSVMHNGAAGMGFQVALRRTDENGAAGRSIGGRGPGGGMFGGMGGGMREFRAAVGPSGRFVIRDVPAGQYELTVSGGRRQGALHQQRIDLQGQQELDLLIEVTTSKLEGIVTAEAGTDPTKLNGSVTLLPGLTEAPADLRAAQRDTPGAVNGRLQAGKFHFEWITPGQYLAVLSVRGRARTAQPIFVAAGSNAPLTLTAGAPAAPAAPGTAPNAPPVPGPAGPPNRR